MRIPAPAAYSAWTGLDPVGGPGADRGLPWAAAEPIGPRLAQTLQVVRARTEVRIAELQALLSRIGEYEAEHADDCPAAPMSAPMILVSARAGLDSPCGGRP